MNPYTKGAVLLHTRDPAVGFSFLCLNTPSRKPLESVFGYNSGEQILFIWENPFHFFYIFKHTIRNRI